MGGKDLVLGDPEQSLKTINFRNTEDPLSPAKSRGAPTAFGNRTASELIPPSSGRAGSMLSASFVSAHGGWLVSEPKRRSLVRRKLPFSQEKGELQVDKVAVCIRPRSFFLIECGTRPRDFAAEGQGEGTVRVFLGLFGLVLARISTCAHGVPVARPILCV